MRFFAQEEDLSHEAPDAPLPDAVVDRRRAVHRRRRDGRRLSPLGRTRRPAVTERSEIVRVRVRRRVACAQHHAGKMMRGELEGAIEPDDDISIGRCSCCNAGSIDHRPMSFARSRTRPCSGREAFSLVTTTGNYGSTTRSDASTRTRIPSGAPRVGCSARTDDGSRPSSSRSARGPRSTRNCCFDPGPGIRTGGPAPGCAVTSRTRIVGSTTSRTFCWRRRRRKRPSNAAASAARGLGGNGQTALTLTSQRT